MWPSRVAYLCFALATLSAQSFRVRSKSKKQQAGPHKCTITWPGKAPVSVSFGVANCRIKCSLSHPDASPDKHFGLRAVQGKNGCSCLTKEGREVLKFHSKTCGEEACLSRYVSLISNEVEYDSGPKDGLFKFHPKPTPPLKFDCAQNGCSDGECDEQYLPTYWDTRTAEEKIAVVEAIRRVAGGDTDTLSFMLNLLQSLSKDDLLAAAALAKKEADFQEETEIAGQIQALILRVENDDDLIAKITEQEDDEHEAFGNAATETLLEATKGNTTFS